MLAGEHGQVGVVPPKLVGEPQGTAAGELSLRGFVQTGLLLSEFAVRYYT